MDSVVVGKFVSENALASVGASYAVTNVFIAVAIGGGMGSSVIISQFLGAGRLTKMKTAVSTTLISFLVISAALGAFGLAFNDRIFESDERAGQYFRGCGSLSADLFLGTALFVHVQRAGLGVQLSGRFQDASVFSDRFFSGKYFSGFLVCGRTWPGSGRRGLGDLYCSGDFRCTGTCDAEVPAYEDFL